MLSHAGTGLWLQAIVSAGNTLFAQALAVAAASVARVVVWAGLPAAFSLVRFDGAGGHFPAVAAVVQHGLHYLVRLGSCSVLNEPGALDRLAVADWKGVPDSGSGPRRQATELGSWALSKDQWMRETPDHEALRSRLVVSRFPCTDGKKHGAGVVHGDWRYEVLATDICAVAWPAADTVTLYYGRCGQENAFGNSVDELRLGDVHSFTVHGQRIMTAISMWVANLRRVMAAEHAGKLGEPLPQTARPAEAQTADVAAGEVDTVQQLQAGDGSAAATDAVGSAASDADEVAGPETPEPTGASLVPPAETAPANPTSFAQTASVPANEQTELATQRPQVTPYAGAKAAPNHGDPNAAAQARPPTGPPLSLTCAAGLAIPLHNLRRLTTGDQAYAIYRGSAATCGVCVQRQACTLDSHENQPPLSHQNGPPA